MADELEHFTVHEDFPALDIKFYDIHGLLAKPTKWQEALFAIAPRVRVQDPTHLMAADARGFLMAGALSAELGLPLVLARKPGKLPPPVFSVDFDTEYNTTTLTCGPHLDHESRVYLLDDVLATAGTIKAMESLVKIQQGMVVGAAFLLEITALQGRSRLSYPVYAWAKTPET